MNLLAHLFLPRDTNNFRPKTLQPSGLLLIAVIFLTIYILQIPAHVAKVLGYTAQRLPVERITELTNQKRTERGLLPLRIDRTLAEAATAKGRNMLNEDYWAHVGPDGKTPWYFFDNSGYEYRYAGENLARDFESPESVVEAWMASPSHRKNLLSEKYEDIGISVVEGELAGNPTTLVVQLLGTRVGYAGPVARFPEEGRSQGSASFKQEESAGLPISGLSRTQAPSPFKLQRTVSLVLIGILLLILTVDALVIWNKKVIRIAGRNFAHFSFLASVGLLLFIIKQGSIL